MVMQWSLWGGCIVEFAWSTCVWIFHVSLIIYLTVKVTIIASDCCCN